MKDIKMKNDKNDLKERLGGSKGEGRNRRVQRGERQIEKESVKRETKQSLHYRRAEFYKFYRLITPERHRYHFARILMISIANTILHDSTWKDSEHTDQSFSL